MAGPLPYHEVQDENLETMDEQVCDLFSSVVTRPGDRTVADLAQYYSHGGGQSQFGNSVPCRANA